MKLTKKISIFTASMFAFNVLSTGIMPSIKVKAAEVTTYKALSSDFITRNGDTLMEGTNPFRFVSFNVPELTMNESPYFRIPSNFDQEDSIKSIAAVGGKVTRTYVISAKKTTDTPDVPRHVEGVDTQGKLIFNEAAFVAFDNALALSHKYGVRLFVPLVDNWNWWGGIHEYDTYAGVATNTSLKDDLFWTDPKVRALFKQTISYVLNRVNTKTGVAYKNDPAILAWETGNELAAPDEWTKDISAYIKSLDSNHLVMDGRQGTMSVSSTDYPNIDVLSNHYYGGGNYAARATADRVASKDKKPFIVGEFGITDTPTMQNLVDEVINNGSVGTMVWSLRQHKPEGGFHSHLEYNGVYAYHLPGFTSGDSYAETDIVNMIRNGAAKINGLTVTPALPAPDAPTLLPITSVANLNWQGSVGASGYNIERSDSATGTFTVVGTNVSDSQMPGTPLFHDTTAATGSTYYYRINAQNSTGTSGYSNVVGPVVAKHIIEDDMDAFTNMYLHSSNLEFNGDNMPDFGNDYNRLRISSKATLGSPESIVYATPTTASSITVATYFNTTDVASDFKFETSTDNSTFAIATPTRTEDVIVGSNWKKVTYTFSTAVDANVKFIKISFPTNETSVTTAPQIGRADIEYNFNGTGTLPVIVAPIMSGVITDELNDSSNIYKQSLNLNFDTTNPIYAGGDTSRLTRSDNKVASIVYKTFGDLNSFRATAYFGTTDALSGFKFYTSLDGTTFTDFIPTTNDLGGNWKKVVYEAFNVPAGTRYLKIEFPISAADANNWSPELGKVELGVGALQVSKPASKATNIIDTFENYGGSDAVVGPQYVRNPGGDAVAVTLSGTNKIEGSYGMNFSYQLGASGYAGVDKNLDKADYSGYNSLKLWVKPDGTGNDLTFQFQTGQGRYWEGHYIMTKGDTTGKFITIPFSDFKQPSWDQHEVAMDLGAMAKFAIYVGGSDKTANSVYFDSIQVTNPLVIENADTYGGDNTILQSKWSLNPGGDPATVSLDATNKADGNAGMKLDYKLTAGKGYAGLEKALGGADYTGNTALKLWVKPDGTGNNLTFQFKDSVGHYWEGKYVMTGTTEGFITIPFSTFTQPSWDTKVNSMNLSGMDKFAIYLGGNNLSANTVYLDSIQVVNTATEVTAVTVAAGIKSVVAPAKNAKTLTLPTAPYGYSIAIKSVTPAGVIETTGIITPPTADTTVAVVFTVTNTTDKTTADTASINVVVPAKSTGVTPGLKWNFEDGTLQGWVKGWGSAFPGASDDVTYSEDMKTLTNKGSAKLNVNFTKAWGDAAIKVPLTSDGTAVDLSQYPIVSFDVYVPVLNKDLSNADLVSLKPQIDFDGPWNQGPDLFVDLAVAERITIGATQYAKAHVESNLALTGSSTYFVLKIGNDSSAYSGPLYIDNINLGNSNYTAVTTTTVAAGITSVAAPAKDSTGLTLPTVPQGYTIAIKSVTPAGVIATTGTITPPAADTTVAVVFTVTNTTDKTTADTASINVVVPAKTVVITPPVVTPPVIVSIVTKTDDDSNIVATLDSSKIDKNNVNVIKIDEPKSESKVKVQIPAAFIGTGTGSYEINTKAASLSLPTSIIDSSLLSSGGTLQVSQNLMAAKDASVLLLNIPLGAKSNGKVFTFGMAVYDSNNNVVSTIHNFASGKSAGVTINLSSDDIKGMDTSKVSAFYFDVASKKWVDMGGSFDSVKMTYTFNTTHFTDFTIMQKPAVNVNRLSGLNRIESSIAIAKEQYTDKKPDAVVITTANDFADALAGSGLAYKYNAPLLLVDKSISDNKAVFDYITTNLSKDKNIYILGETGVVSKEIADYLTTQGYKIIRLGGKDRYETNKKIVDYLNVVKGTSLVITTGDDFADALSISSIADIKGFPVLLNGKDNLSASVSSYITTIEPTTIYVVGGAGVLSANIETQIKKLNANITVVRLGGKDRYETSILITDYFNLTTTTITVATGIDFPDALSGSVLAARKNSGVLLVDNKDVTKQKDLLSKEKITNVIVFGGEGVVSNNIATSLMQK